LIAGFALASATAQAGEPRSLSLASEALSAAAPAPVATPAAETPKTAEAPQTTEAPKYIERPALVETRSEPAKTETPKTEPLKTEQPKAAQSNVDTAKPVAEKTASKSDKPRRKRYWTESRIIGELHRHGIYW
jgi:outer membrane biosynthesis protein TonB